MKRLLWIILAFALAAPVFGQNLLLDDYPGAFAGYSLRKIDKDHAGAIIRVERSSDQTQQDIGLSGDSLDVSALTTFCGANDCAVVKWYSQISGDPALETDYLVAGVNPVDPMIVRSGTVVRDEQGKPVIDFAGNAAMYTPTALQTSIDADSSSIYIKFQTDSLDFDNTGDYEAFFQLGTNHADGTSYTWRDASWQQILFANTQWSGESDFLSYANGNTIFSYHVGGQFSDSTKAYDRFDLIEAVKASSIADHNRDQFVIGAPAKNNEDPEWNGKIGEIVALPYIEAESEIQDVFDDLNSYWEVAPIGYHRAGHPCYLLPQKENGDIILCDWLESVNDTTYFSYHEAFPNHPADTIAVWNASASYHDALSDEQIADIYVPITSASMSSVVRADPCWYVLDGGESCGITSTGSVRLIHKPKDPEGDPLVGGIGGGGYGGNPSTAWCNEISFWYRLDVPRPGLSNGNKLYKHPVIGRRALSCAIASMMEWRDNWGSGQASWTDFFGRAALSWAEVYRDAGELLDSTTAAAYRELLQQVSQKIINFPGARGVNTNLDIFAMRGLAIQHSLPDADSTMRAKAAEAVSVTLLGQSDGAIGSAHTIYDASTSTSVGVYHPACGILEGGQCEFFYQGESILHLAGALADARDRATGDLEEDMEVFASVVDSAYEWQSYQVFRDPAVHNNEGPKLCEDTENPSDCYMGGAGYSGRTGGGPLNQQTNKRCSDYVAAYETPEGIFWAIERHGFPSRSSMLTTIENKLSDLNDYLLSGTSGTIDVGWSSESPWVKVNCFNAPIGWWDEINLWRTYAPQYDLPPFRRDQHYNRSFGGYPTGPAFWAYKNEDETGEDFGWFIEAQPHQGTYGGWYGGKVETMWADSVGIITLNRHGKTGCDGSTEDSGCWTNMDVKAGMHTWGWDENGSDSLFTTLFVHGQEIDRPVDYSLGDAQPNVSVTTKFVDPLRANETSSIQNDNGMRSETIHTAQFDVTHKFTALSNGLQVDVTVETSQEDSIQTLQTTLPIYLRNCDSSTFTGGQCQMENPLIERDSSGVWVQMREEDADVDGYPDWVDTRYLKITKDWELASMGQTQSWYIDLTQTESVRLSESVYEDPYQSQNRFRNVHIDLHGSPGTTILAPASTSVTYKLLTTDPTE